MNIGFGGVSSYITPFWIARCLRALFPQEEIEITYDQLGTLKHANKYVKVLYFFLVDIPFFRFSWLKLLHFLVNQPISMVEHPRELNPGHFDWASTNHFGFVSCEKPKSGHQFYVTFWKRS